MSRLPANDPERRRAHGRLMSILADLLDSGRRIPCTGSNRAAWTAEDDRDATEYAAAQCLACSALQACREYVTAFPEPVGVWAGLLPTERSKSK